MAPVVSGLLHRHDFQQHIAKMSAFIKLSAFKTRFQKLLDVYLRRLPLDLCFFLLRLPVDLSFFFLYVVKRGVLLAGGACKQCIVHCLCVTSTRCIPAKLPISKPLLNPWVDSADPLNSLRSTLDTLW